MKTLEDLGTVITSDVLVLGAGGAGMCAALKAQEQGADVVIVDKGGAGWCGQVPIGGGILAYVYPEYADTWAEKVIRGSYYFANQLWTYAFGRAMHGMTYGLEAYGVPFHRKNKEIEILNWGPNIHVTLFDAPKSLVSLKKTAKQRGIRMIDKVNIVDLLKKDGRVVGAVGLGLTDGKMYFFNAKSTIVALGNCGFMHEKTYASCLGDGAAVGYRAGAQLINAEFNTSYVWGTRILGKELFGIHFYLYLENASGERIMGKYYPELVEHVQPVYTFDPRVIDAMQKEVLAGRGPIYLNLQGLSDAEIESLSGDENVDDRSYIMANNNMKLLREKAAIEPRQERIEMEPTLLYSGGGMRIDIQGRTTVEGLWAAGAASNNAWNNGAGSQGGLGVASAAVTGFVAGESAGKHAVENTLASIDVVEAERILSRATAPLGRTGDMDAHTVAYRVHDAVVPMKYNRQREAGRMKEALSIVSEARQNMGRVGAKDFHDLARFHQAESMAMAAEASYRAALMREESRAGHFREDFPQRDDVNWFKWITVQEKDGRPFPETAALPLETYPLKP